MRATSIFAEERRRRFTGLKGGDEVRAFQRVVGDEEAFAAQNGSRAGDGRERWVVFVVESDENDTTGARYARELLERIALRVAPQMCEHG